MKNITTIRTSLVAASMLLALSVSATTTHAQNISANNVFTGTSVVTQGFYHLNPADNPTLTSGQVYGNVVAQAGVNAENYGTPAGATNGTTSYSTPGIDWNLPDYAEAGYDPTVATRSPYGAVNITGFDSAIDTLDIYSDNGGRDATTLTIYYAPNITTSTVASSYHNLLGTFTLGYATGTQHYINNATQSGFYYDTLSGLDIPTGTQSLLLQFTYTNTQYVPIIAEVQGFAPAAATPEPSTYALVFFGMGGLLLIRKMRTQHLSA